MGIFKSQEILKKIGNNELLISETVIVDNQDHLTNGEYFIFELTLTEGPNSLGPLQAVPYSCRTTI